MRRLEARAYLHRGLTVVFENEADGQTQTWHYEDGIRAYLVKLLGERGETPVGGEIFYTERTQELDGARIDALLTFPTRIAQSLTGLRVGPRTNVGDKSVFLVQGNGPRGSFANLYFDRQSGLLLRTIRYTPSQIGKVPTQVDYEDYRDVGGIKFPFRWTYTWLDGRDTFEFASVRFNEPIDPAKFGEPIIPPGR